MPQPARSANLVPSARHFIRLPPTIPRNRVPNALPATAEILTPKLPVEHPIVHGLADVLRQNVGLAVQVGDRAGHAEDFVVRAGREAGFLNAGPQQVRARVAELAILTDLPRGHVAVGPGRRIEEPRLLHGS